MTRIKEPSYEHKRGVGMKDLNEILDSITVMEPGEWENDTGPKDWFAVITDRGIVAYTGTEELAFKLRLWLVNDLINPLPKEIFE